MWGTIKDWWAVVSSVLLIVVLMAKHFKAFLDVLPSLQKLWKYGQKRWFKNAIFQADVLLKLEQRQLADNLRDAKIDSILAEVRFNGGTYKLVDALKDIQADQKDAKNQILYLRGLRDINDKFDPAFRFRYHPDKGCTFIAESFLRAFGCRESDVLGFSYEEMVHADDVAEMRLKWNQAANKCTNYRDQQRIKSATGDYVVCMVLAEPIKDTEGKLVEFVGIIEVLR